MDTELVIENLVHGLRNYGYAVISEPVSADRDAWIEQLRDAMEKVERTADGLRRDYGYRGRSARLLKSLHSWLPEPMWGVEVDPRFHGGRVRLS